MVEKIIHKYFTHLSNVLILCTLLGTPDVLFSDSIGKYVNLRGYQTVAYRGQNIADIHKKIMDYTTLDKVRNIIVHIGAVDILNWAIEARDSPYAFVSLFQGQINDETFDSLIRTPNLVITPEIMKTLFADLIGKRIAEKMQDLQFDIRKINEHATIIVSSIIPIPEHEPLAISAIVSANAQVMDMFSMCRRTFFVKSFKCFLYYGNPKMQHYALDKIHLVKSGWEMLAIILRNAVHPNNINQVLNAQAKVRAQRRR